MKTFRYDLPPVQGQGWATVVLGADGFFAAVADFGNYAFRWAHHGECDFRLFVVRGLARDPDYFLGKVSHEVYDGRATEHAIRGHIIEYRRRTWWSKEKALKEWELLNEFPVGDGAEQFSLWCAHTSIVDACELRVDAYPANARAFAEQTLPRLAARLRAEMAAEAPLAAEHPS